MNVQAVLLLLVLVAPAVRAQQSDAVAIKRGSVMRLRGQPDVPFQVVRVWNDSVRVRKEGVRSRTITTADAARFETRHETSNSRAAGAAVGLMIGMMAGAVVGNRTDDFFSDIYPVVGGVLGTAIGLAAAPTHYTPWMPVTFPRDTLGRR